MTFAESSAASRLVEAVICLRPNRSRSTAWKPCQPTAGSRLLARMSIR